MRFNLIYLSWRWIIWFILLGFYIFSRNVAFERRQVEIFPIIPGQKAEISYFRTHPGFLLFKRVNFRYNSEMELNIRHQDYNYKYIVSKTADTLSFRAENYLMPIPVEGGRPGTNVSGKIFPPLLGFGYNHLSFEIVKASPDLQGEKLRIVISAEIETFKEADPGSQTQYFIVYISTVGLFLINIFYLIRDFLRKRR